MPHNHRPIAKTYDEVVRATVPDPDSSWRPTPAQERRAFEGERILDAAEQQLYAKVCDALLAVCDVDVRHVDVEVERDRVSLRGHVHHYRDLACIENAIARLEGVEEIVDYLVVDDSHT